VKQIGKMDIRKLTFHQLRVFLAVAYRSSFTRAAEDLLISQSAVSVQIKELTELLGVPLFDQVGKKIYVTEAGRVLEEQAKRIGGIVDDINCEFLAWREGGAGVVRVGGSTSIGTYILPSVIATFTTMCPGIEITMETENTSDIEERLLRSDFDVAFIGRAVSSSMLKAESFLEDEIIFACAPSHPFSTGRPPSAKKVSGEKIFVREPGSATRRSMEEHCLRRGVVFENTVQLGSVEAAKQAVMAGLGVSYFSSLTVKNEMETGRLVPIRVRGLVVRRTFYLVRLQKKRETPALRQFIDFARSWRLKS
jgi:DNA-binding transcriptional LysR family regulator